MQQHTLRAYRAMVMARAFDTNAAALAEGGGIATVSNFGGFGRLMRRIAYFLEHPAIL